MLSQQKSLIAITGFDQGTPIEIDPKHLYKATNKTDTPAFSAILSTADPQQLSALIATAGNKIKFKSSVFLTPFLMGDLVEEGDLSVEKVFRIITKRILQREEDLFHELKDNWKASNNIADDADQSLYDPLFDYIRAESELGYGDVVYFLYKLITKEDSIHSTNCIPVVNIDTNPAPPFPSSSELTTRATRYCPAIIKSSG